MPSAFPAVSPRMPREVDAGGGVCWGAQVKTAPEAVREHRRSLGASPSIRIQRRGLPPMVDENQANGTHWLHPVDDSEDETLLASALFRANSVVSRQAAEDRNLPVFLLSDLIDSVLLAETLEAAQQEAAAVLIRYLTYRIERPL